MLVRNYTPTDYENLKALYMQEGLYGGQFDADRDSAERVNALSTKDPESILVCEDENKMVGTVSLIENGRVAWLFRFAVEEGSASGEVVLALYGAAVQILKSRGHTQVLVYSPVDNQMLDDRYEKSLGFTKGNNYICFWKQL